MMTGYEAGQTHPSGGAEVYRSRLVRTYGGFALVGIVVAIAYGVAAFVYGSSELLRSGAVAFAAACALLGVRWMILRDKDMIAALVLLVGLFAGGLFYTWARPGSVASIALIPIVVVVLAMPLLNGMRLRWLIAGAWATGVALVVFNLVLARVDPLPAFTIGVRAFGYAAVLFIVLVLLLAYNQRMMGLMDESRKAEATVRQANRKLLELDRAKTTFMNMVSHELRTPLTPVLLQLRLLGDGGFGPLKEKQVRSVQIVTRNIERLNTITSELLDLARLQSGRIRLTIEQTDLDALVLEVVESFKDVAKTKRILFVTRFEGVGRVPVDAKRVVQVLYNLIDNAMKFTGEDGRVEIEVRRRGDEVEVRVKDSGRGMTTDQKERLFQAFSRVHDKETGTEPGTGLGLYICKTIVEAHGGRIWAESDGDGQGATFAFLIPSKTEAATSTEFDGDEGRMRLRQTGPVA